MAPHRLRALVVFVGVIVLWVFCVFGPCFVDWCSVPFIILQSFRCWGGGGGVGCFALIVLLFVFCVSSSRYRNLPGVIVQLPGHTHILLV